MVYECWGLYFTLAGFCVILCLPKINYWQQFWPVLPWEQRPWQLAIATDFSGRDAYSLLVLPKPALSDSFLFKSRCSFIPHHSATLAEEIKFRTSEKRARWTGSVEIKSQRLELEVENPWKRKKGGKSPCSWVGTGNDGELYLINLFGSCTFQRNLIIICLHNYLLLE